MRFIDLNRRKEIGSSCLFVSIGSFNILFDCGVSPKYCGYESLPDFKKIGTSVIDLVLISHCHLDHIGALPYFMKNQQQARVLMSQASHVVMPRILNNSVNVMKLQRDEFGIKEYPLFTQPDIEALEEHILPMQFGKTRTLIKDDEEIKITFYSAGHVVGASSILIEHKHRKIFYTGDIAFRNQKTLRGAKWPNCNIDIVFTETTRGATERQSGHSADSEIKRLIETIDDTTSGGGSVLIPAFAFGRMQEVLKIIHDARKENKLDPKIPIFCSGLGLGLIDDFDLIAKRLSAVDFRRKIARELRIKIFCGNNPTDIKRSNRRPSIYVLSSGMLVENTSAYNVAAALLDDHKNTICFVGFCDPDTPGGELLRSRRGDQFLFKSHGYCPKINANIERFDMSGHADREETLQNVSNLSPHSIVLVHGEEPARDWFMDSFLNILPKTQTIDPTPGEAYKL